MLCTNCILIIIIIEREQTNCKFYAIQKICDVEDKWEGKKKTNINYIDD